MRKTGLFIVLAILSTTLAHAQMHFGFFGTHASSPQSAYRSFGGGMSLLSGTLTKESFPLSAQLGGGYYVAGAGQGNLDNQDGQEVSFSNMQVGVSALARFSVKSQTSRRVPYFDLFGGILNNSSSMTAHHATNHDECSSTSLHSSTGFMGGAGAGILFRLSKSTFLDVGLSWQSSTAPGKFVDMKSAVNTGDGISYRFQNIPAGMLVFRIGLQIRTNSDGCRCSENCKIRSHHAKTCYLGGEEK